MSRLSDIKRFYDLLELLASRSGGARTTDTLSNYRDWPTRGVYFFFEPSESRRNSGNGNRVVRVGTHAVTASSKSTLRQRLGQHRGNISGGGNHRGSIFRLLVGQALLKNGAVAPCNSWGIKSEKGKASETLQISREALDAAEAPVELAVSDYMATMPFLWLKVDDQPARDSLRGVIEQNTIALLSNYERAAIDPPSAGWLGHNSNRNLVRESGLWNQQHVTETYDSDYLDILETLINSATLVTGVGKCLSGHPRRKRLLL
jgi:hypothetical protein